MKKRIRTSVVSQLCVCLFFAWVQIGLFAFRTIIEIRRIASIRLFPVIRIYLGIMIWCDCLVGPVVCRYQSKGSKTAGPQKCRQEIQPRPSQISIYAIGKFQVAPSELCKFSLTFHLENSKTKGAVPLNF